MFITISTIQIVFTNYCNATVESMIIMCIVCVYLTKAKCVLGHINTIPAKGGHQGGADTIYHSEPQAARERSHTVNVQHE